MTRLTHRQLSPAAVRCSFVLALVAGAMAAPLTARGAERVVLIEYFGRAS
jgi:hypothetical protein